VKHFAKTKSSIVHPLQCLRAFGAGSENTSPETSPHLKYDNDDEVKVKGYPSRRRKIVIFLLEMACFGEF